MRRTSSSGSPTSPTARKKGTEYLSKRRPPASTSDTLGSGIVTSKVQPPSPDDSRTTSPTSAEEDSPGSPEVTFAGATGLLSSVAAGEDVVGEGPAAGAGAAASGAAPHAAATNIKTDRIRLRIVPLI